MADQQIIPMEAVVHTLQIAGMALAKHEEQALGHAKEAAACLALVPSVVEAAVRSGRIEPHQKEAMAAALASPANTLELLKQALQAPEAAPAPLGSQVGQDGAGTNGRSKQASAFDGLPPGGRVGGPSGQRSPAWDRADDRLRNG